ncbi:hypothetical protein [Evansella clarkii]|uniref:hypothetical protein n=1 Tax=Evansella clarkii TaxID=79879 RepID=UPI0009972F85|nr:hypothetical protein [Evansella clarkii]
MRAFIFFILAGYLLLFAALLKLNKVALRVYAQKLAGSLKVIVQRKLPGIAELNFIHKGAGSWVKFMYLIIP